MTESIFSVEIASKKEVADQIFEFILRPLGDQALPAPLPGAHIDVHVAEGLTRQYSLTNGPDQTDNYTIGVLRDADGRGGSQYFCDNYQVGDRIEIGTPRNLFPLEPADELILVAGGIGITPVFSMLKHAVRSDTQYQFHYLIRNRQRAAFLDTLSEICGNRLHLHCDEERSDRVDLEALLGEAKAGKHLYVCGPEGLIHAIEAEAEKSGWAKANIHYELFSRAEPLTHDSDSAFELVLADTDQVVTVAADETALEALQREGFEVPFSCEQGVCGSCLMSVDQGMPDHRDMFLTDAEREANNCFTPCCSRASTPSLRVKLPA